MIIENKGNFVCKIWKGSQDKIIINKLKKKFVKVNNFKPISSRIKSSEIYIVAQNFFN